MDSYHIFDRHERKYVNPEPFTAEESALNFVEVTYTVSEWPLLEVHRVRMSRSDDHKASSVMVMRIKQCPAVPMLDRTKGDKL